MPASENVCRVPRWHSSVRNCARCISGDASSHSPSIIMVRRVSSVGTSSAEQEEALITMAASGALLANNAPVSPLNRPRCREQMGSRAPASAGRGGGGMTAVFAVEVGWLARC